HGLEALEAALELTERVARRAAYVGPDPWIDVDALDPDREERRVGEREAAKDETRRHQVFGRVVAGRNDVELLLQQLEGAPSEGCDERVLRAERGVDGPRRRRDGVGDAPDRQPTHALGV